MKEKLNKKKANLNQVSLHLTKWKLNEIVDKNFF